MKFLTALTVLASCSALASATPLVKRLPSGSDPAYTLSKAQLDSVLACQNGSPSSQKNPILLVPGTGTTGPQSFDSNWIPLSTQLGYSPCWVSPPPFMLNDTQVNAEYIVNAVKVLSSASGAKVPVLTWSQGGLAAQWALTFFPSIRTQVDRLMAFAPDYKGTVLAAFLTTPGLASESVWQQQAGSALTTALANAGGLTKIVPTTNLYSATDDIVQPQTFNGPLDSGYLNGGAKNIQAQSVCGPLFVVDHAGTLTSQFSFVVGRSALRSTTGQAQSKDYGVTDCNPLPADSLTPDQKLRAEGLLLVAGANVAAGPKQNCEPDLMPYARQYAVGKRTCSGVIL
ncbi:probable Lipase B precursor [Sporisorium reilianum SRZ2]|uniref:Probable Lipase B n=1 Tax=Sporisorium reilianum (strain SRZ2) TaxID=999809 RepID=E6ZUC1_SPORE|nr:probable Lipase B precursor [Sporisorium reilianum SRZ2]